MTKQVPAASWRGRRGFTMVLALFFLLVLLLVAVAVLSTASQSSIDALSVSVKNKTFDAAEAGFNSALQKLAENQNTASSTSGNGTVNNNSFSWTVVANNFNQPASDATDPETGGSVFIPNGTAYIYGTASTITGGRTVYVEGIISTFQWGPDGALRAADDVTASGQASVLADNPPANNNANVLTNGNLTGSGQASVQGAVYVRGTATTSGQWTATNGIQTGVPLIPFPTRQQAMSYASTIKALAQSGQTLTPAQFSSQSSWSGNIYVSGPIVLSGKSSLTMTGGALYVNGSVTLSGQSSLINSNTATVVINGDLTSSGQSVYKVKSGAPPGVLMVLGTGGTTLSGQNQSVGFVWIPFGDVTISGQAGLTGKIVAGDKDTCNYANNCGTATLSGQMQLQYDSSAKPPKLPGVSVLSWWN